MPLETTLRPRPPYSLHQSAWRANDATRFFHDGIFTAAYETDGRASVARVSQRPDGSLAVRLDGRADGEALARLRFLLAVDADHSPFLARFRDDSIVGPAIRRFPGMRPLRLGTVVHALLKAVCGQLIQAKAARLLENRLVRLATGEHGGLRLPPTRSTFARFSAAELERHGLVARKANALLRVSRELELERLHAVPTGAAAARIERERGLGPWSAGMVCLYGLGRFERGLAGDLSLIRICAELRGRPAGPEDTHDLLEPYGDWAGLASLYILAGAKGIRTVRPTG